MSATVTNKFPSHGASPRWTHVFSQCADCVEWVPATAGHFVTGNYHLQPDGQRVGAITLFAHSETATTSDPAAAWSFTAVHCVESAAVLDMKWQPAARAAPTLAVASADGAVRIYALDSDAPRLGLVAATATRPAIALSLAWAPVPVASLAVSYSDGRVATWTPDLAPVREWQGHEYEAWITTWDMHNPHVVYSGADDTLLKGWDVRDGCHRPVFTNSSHEAGVCSLQSHPQLPHVLVSGSYDERLRVWDTRHMKSPTHTGSRRRFFSNLPRVSWDGLRAGFFPRGCVGSMWMGLMWVG